MRGGDPFRTVSSGERLRIPAPAWNALMRLLQQSRRGGQRAAPASRSDQYSGDVIQVRNVTGTDLDAFSIVAIKEPTFTPSDSLSGQWAARGAMEASTPTIPGDEGRWAVVLDPIPSGAMGYAVASGVAACKIDTTDYTGPVRYAEARNDDVTSLRVGGAGSATVLWIDTEGADPKWAIIRIGPPRIEVLNVKITGESGFTEYSWEEVVPPGETARTGGNGEDEPAVKEVNGAQAIEPDTQVMMWVDAWGGYWCDVSYQESMDATDPAASSTSQDPDTLTWERKDQPETQWPAFGGEGWGVKPRVFTRWYAGEVGSEDTKLPRLFSRQMGHDSTGDLNKIFGEDYVEVGVELANAVTDLSYSEGSGTVSYNESKIVVLAKGTPEAKSFVISGGGGGADEKVKVTSSETAADYLSAQLVSGDPWLVFTVQMGGGGDQWYEITHANPQAASSPSKDVTTSFVAFDPLDVNDDTGGLAVDIFSRTAFHDGKGHYAGKDDAATFTFNVPQVINDLADVMITSPTHQQMIGYDDGDATWKNMDVPAGPDEKVRVTSLDTTTGFLDDKMAPGNAWITLAPNPSGGGAPQQLLVAHAAQQDQNFTQQAVASLTTLDDAGTRKLRITVNLLPCDEKGHVRGGAASPTATAAVDLPLTAVTSKRTRYNAAANKFQKKLRVHYAVHAEAEDADWSDDADCDQPTTQTVVTSNQIDGTNKKFQNKTNTVGVLKKDAESGWTDYHTGQGCSG